MRLAVVGHVEWIRFARVETLPGRGEIAHAHDEWEQAGGGGGVAAAQLALLCDEVHLFTSFGSDELGRRARAELEGRDVRVHASTAPGPTRWALVHVDDGGERTITTVGRKWSAGGTADLPWYLLSELDGVVFVAGDVAAAKRARKAPVVTATARELDTLRRAGIALDALVRSGADPGEAYSPGDLDPEPALVVTTSGHLGGWMQPGGPYAAAALETPVIDTYGAGDCFLAGLTFALAAGRAPAAATAFAARCGAGALAGRGVAPAAIDPRSA